MDKNHNIEAMSRIFLVDLEAVETRYTGQWKTHVPNLLRKAGHDVQIISGPEDIPKATTPGAFLNFGGTIYTKLDRLSRWAVYFVTEPFIQAITLSLLMLGTRVS